MNFIQDPYKPLGELQQCLSSNKRPLGLFVGAGCSMAIRLGDEQKSPLIPDIAGITQIVRKELGECADCGPLLKTVEEHFKKDGRENTTVEDILTHIRALRAVAGNDEVRGLSAKNLDALDEKICQLIHDIADKNLPNDETPYHRVASWVGEVPRENPIEVFTTNYDLLMEQAFEERHVPYFDGFAGVRRPFFDLQAMEEDVLPPRWARLWKLHGSINWYHIPDRGVFRGTTGEIAGSKRVIHPSHLKYQESRRMPYLAMADQLRDFLKKPTATLVLCGYSFRDDHINEVIVNGLQSTQGAVAFALLFDELSNYRQARDLARKCSNLNILALDGSVIGRKESTWPERDAEAAPADIAKWVKWTPINPATANGKQKATFTLGDFAVFGQFLQELVGSVRRSQEVPNV